MKTHLLLSSLFCLLFFASPSFSQNAVLRGPIKISPDKLTGGVNMTVKATVEGTGSNSSVIIISGGIDNKEIYKQTFHLSQNQKQLIHFSWKATNGKHKAYFKILKPINVSARMNKSGRIMPNKRLLGAKTKVLYRTFQVGYLEVPKPKTVQKIALKPAEQASNNEQPPSEAQPVCDEQPPLPDLIVSVSDASGSGYVGSTVSIRVTVTNAGQCASRSCKLQLFVNTSDPGTLVGEVTVPALQPQERSSQNDCSFSHDFNYTIGYGGNYQFHAIVDPGLSVWEFREDNNDAYGGDFVSVQR